MLDRKYIATRMLKHQVPLQLKSTSAEATKTQIIAKVHNKTKMCIGNFNLTIKLIGPANYRNLESTLT